MTIRTIKPSREGVSNLAWKVRCKLRPPKDTTLATPFNLDTNSEDDAKASTVLDKDPNFGADATVKTLYEGRNSTAASFVWVNHPPKQLSKSAARAQDRVAIKVYKIKDHDKPCLAGKYQLKYHEIEIQNASLVAALAPIVKKENVNLDIHDVATFTEPFRPLWFCHDDIKALWRDKDASVPLKGYLKLLMRVLDDVFSSKRLKQKHLVASGLIGFELAWTLFSRGSTLYSYGLNTEFISTVESTTYVTKNGCKSLVIKGSVLTFNGEEFIWQDKTLTIPPFAGNQLICELPHYPFDLHHDKETIHQRLIARGKKVFDLQGLTYCCYNGIAIHNQNKENLERHNVEGRVLIDVVGYNKYHLALGKRENEDPEATRRRARPRRHKIYERLYEDLGEEVEDEASEQPKPKDKNRRLPQREQEMNKEEMLERVEELGFMSEMIGGFALKNKIWVQFYVEDIEPMVWNDTAYSHLVYDDQQKDLVLSFVENHKLHNAPTLPTTNEGRLVSNAPMDDVIVGKGQGLIILLSGPPGTGKTLTAEAVADRTHRPLFYLQAEDLGINAATLGANIKRVFEMATEWDAVILLDEADVFMAERNPNDIHRNELVSIFLRELEYFRGIIFLTTNLYHTIDSAFRSRVNLHLLFQSLSKEARESIWRKFLDRLPEQSRRITNLDDGEDDEGNNGKSIAEDKPLDDEDIKELSLWQLNGREIKNAIKMVRSWCDHKGYVMTLARLENGIKVTSPHSSKEGNVDVELYD